MDEDMVVVNKPASIPVSTQACLPPFQLCSNCARNWISSIFLGPRPCATLKFFMPRSPHLQVKSENGNKTKLLSLFLSSEWVRPKKNEIENRVSRSLSLWGKSTHARGWVRERASSSFISYFLPLWQRKNWKRKRRERSRKSAREKQNRKRESQRKRQNERVREESAGRKKERKNEMHEFNTRLQSCQPTRFRLQIAIPQE